MSTNVCSFGFDLQYGKSLKGLVDLYGNNSKAMSIANYCIANINEEADYIPSEAFLEYWHKELPLASEPNFQTTDPKVLAEMMDACFNSKHRDIERSAFKSTVNPTVGTYGYQSEQVRKEGLDLVAGYILDVASGFRNNQARRNRILAAMKKNPSINPNSWSFLCRQAALSIRDEIVRRIATRQNKEVATVKKELATAEQDENKNIYQYIREQLGEVIVQDSNLIALLFEMRDNPNFFEEVKANSNLGAVRSALRYSEEEVLDEEIGSDSLFEESYDTEDNISQVGDSTDEYMRDIANKGETATTWTKLIPDNITNYFNSLKKLNSIGKDGTDYDTNNAYGVPYTMNAPTCIAVLLSRCNFYNANTMVADIKKIASQLPGFEAFINLAKDLEANPDFKMAVYHFCARALTSRTEVQLTSKGFKVKQSNETVDRRTRFLYDIQNDIRNNSLNLDYVSIKEAYNDLLSKYKDAVELFKIKDDISTLQAKNDLVQALTSFINYISPEITPQAINAYCEYKESNNKSGSTFASNAFTLIENLKKVADAIKEAQNNNRTILTNIKEAKEHNSKLDKDSNVHDMSEYKDIDALYKTDFMPDSLNSIAQFLAEQLLDYSVVKIDLNGRNSEGKNVSNLIDINLMSNLIKTLSNDEALTNFGKYRLQSMQYTFSNIMIEQTDAQGNIISKGLFRKQGNDYVPTEYAKDLLEIHLFDGVTDINTDNSSLYRKMSKGDFVTTGFNMFVNEVDNAQYFMRIPSDAPKIFTVKAPKTSTVGLITIENQDELDAAINKELASLPIITYNGSLEYATTINNSTNFVNHVLNKLDTIKVNAKKGDNKTIIFRYKTKNSDIYYQLKGNVDENGIMTNPTFVGFVNTGSENNRISVQAKEALIKAITDDFEKNGWVGEDGELTFVRRTVNTSHPVFAMFRNAAKQELHEMGIALNAMFVTDENGIPLRYPEGHEKEGQLQWRAGWETKADRKLKGYKNYHYRGSDVIEIKDGKEVLTGNVFKSNKFTIFDLDSQLADDNGVINDFQSSIEPIIDFLYGGANTVKFRKEGDKVVDVILNENQQEIVDNAISFFLRTYVSDFTKRFSESKDFIDNKHYTAQNIADFALNTRLMYYAFDDLFEGNSKFYGDGQTLLKRAKETQMGGTPYGNVNYTMDFTSKDKQPITSILDEEDIKSTLVHKEVIDGKEVSSPVEIKLYDRFSAVTITGTTRCNKVLLKSLIKELVDSGTDKDVAESIIYGPIELDKNGEPKLDEEGKYVRTKGFQETKVNDAQSYITFEEWVRRIVARGQYNQYRDLIEAILDETKPVDAQLIGQFVQAQKNVYYDLHYDSTTGIIVPRQIKNAEFVLVPRFIKGTELEQLYNAMTRNGIDQINTTETSKAGKHQEVVFWDRDGNLTQDNIDAFDNLVQANGVKEDFFYNYLYTQLETPHHLNAENKAGIQIMKKILDNIDGLPESNPEAASLKLAKKTIIDNFCANIMESFNDLMDECGIERDNNGAIKIDDEGNPVGLDYQLFFNKLKDELLRLGLDSNSIDYITQIDPESNNGVTRMPIYMGNFGKKLQNIANAVFNQTITRQKLPGFHAVQVTQIGWNKFTGEKGKAEYSSKLKYHPNGERYIEVALPASNFGLNKNDERWVNKKNEYISQGKTNEEADELVKQDMLKELADAGLDTIIGYRIPTEGKQSICVMKCVDFIEDGYGSTIVVPDEWVAQTGSDFDVDSVYGIQFTATNGKEKPLKKYSTIIDDEIYEKYKKAVLSKVNDTERNILKLNSERTAESVASGVTKEMTDEDFKESLDEYGAKYGLGTFEEFKESRRKYEDKHSRDIRNNAILENMIKILQSDSMLEENLGRSNFESITEALNKVASSAFKKERAARSPYDFLNQASYQDDAMSGAKLKAFSVTRDTFCSVCNTVRPRLTSNITIKYPKSMFTDEQLKKLKSRFKQVEFTDNYVSITHDSFGWSNDNKNVVGRILTSYSSQTTAHILDAIKEGAIPNVNDFTFCVYKTFVDIGSDYETAIAFMMQPAITELVGNYNKNKSIYADNFMSAIEKTKRDICKRLGKDDAEYCTIKDLNDFINTQVTVDDNIYIDKDVLIKNLSKASVSDRENLNIILQFDKLYNISQDIQDIARCLNPDKFGAKQTIYATRKVFDDIERLLGKGDVTGHVLMTDDEQSVIDAIYPGIRGGIKGFLENTDNESKYPTLYTFLKYASAPSVVVNSSLFDTQHQGFVEQIKGIRTVLSNKNGLSEKTYDELEAYALNTIYQKSKMIRGTIAITDDGKIDVLLDDSDKTVLAETRRIYGYNKGTNFTVINKAGNKVDFTVEDLDHPTTDELNEFAQLSPAQKVAWMKTNYENAGLFDILKTRLRDPNLVDKDGVNTQKITFNDSNEDIEFVINKFNKVFNNNDKLAVMTAIDLIKYAFVVEGFRMRQNGITKIIKNSALYESFNLDNNDSLGTGIVDDIKQGVANFKPVYNFNRTATLYERFLRGHQDISELPKATVKKQGKNGFELNRGALHIITLPKGEQVIETLIKYNIIEETNDIADVVYRGKYYKYNDYVKLTFDDEATLYRVENRDSGVYLLPLNKLLPNETTDVSVKSEFNKEQSVDKLLGVISTLESEGKPFNGSEVSRLIKEGKLTIDNNKANVNKEDTSDDLDIDNPPKEFEGAASILKDKLSKTFGDRSSGELYIQNRLLDEFIKSEGVATTKTKVVTITKPNGTKEKRKFDIYKVPTKTVNNYNKTYLKVQGKDRSISSLPNSLQTIIQSNRDASEYGKDASPIYHLFVITPHVDITQNVDDNTESFSLFEDIENEIDITYKSENQDARKRYADEGFYTSTEVTPLNKHSAIRITAENIENSVNSIMARIYAFEDLGSLDSDEVINAILGDEVLRQKFIATILDAKDYINKHRSWIETSLVGEDTETTYFIKKIQKALGELNNLDVLKKAKDRFIDEYVSKQSTDPRVQSGQIAILNGLYETSISSSLFHDIQETNNTFLQTVLKLVQRNVAAKDLASPKYVNAFKAEIAKYKEEAKAAGVTFDWSHIIDKKGRFTKGYNDKFIADLKFHLDAIQNAITNNNGGKYSIEATRARLAFDKWKIDNIEQKLDKSFYEKKLAIEEEVFNVARDLFVKYKALKDERKEIFNRVDPETGEASPEDQKRLDEIRRDLVNMTSENTYDFKNGTFESKVGDDLTKAKALKKYQTDIKDLYNEYYRNSAKYGFDELLKINQGIIRRKENPDSTGRPQADMTTLLNDEEYINAKQWMAEHAHMVPDATVKAELDEAYKVLKAGKDLENSVSKFATAQDAYDETGVINGTKLTDEQRESIKSKMENDYKNAVDSEDKRILGNAGASSDAYLESFYQGLTVGGRKTVAYKNAVTSINNITKKYYNSQKRTVETFNMSLEDLKELKRLIDALGDIRKNVKGSTTKAQREKAIKFREDYATTVYNEDEFRRQKSFAEQNLSKFGQEWLDAWEALNGTEEEMNEVLYGRLEPKAEYCQKEKVNGKWVAKGQINFIDVKKLNALETIHAYTYQTPTQYWWSANEEWVKRKNAAYAISEEKGNEVQAEYDKWYEANTVYNPYTKQKEPIRCWTTLAYTPAANLDYEPLWKETSSVPKTTSLNPNYRENVPLADNYKRGNTQYDNTEINDYEAKARDYIQGVCKQLVRNKGNIDRLNKGYAPARRKSNKADIKWFGNELAKATGFTMTYGGNDEWESVVDYGNYESPSINMLEELKDKSMSNLGELPRRRIDESEDDFQKRVDEYETKKKEEDENIHAALLDNNWESVFEDFIRQAVHYNAVQDEKEMLFFARDTLKDLKVHSRQYNFYGKFKGKKDPRGKGIKYEDVEDKRIVEQLETFMHRFLYDQWKVPEGKATKIAGLLQSFTSAKYMMLNLRGGVANITYGESQIIAETMAGQFFKGKHYAKAKRMYISAIPGMINKAYSEDSTNLVDALIKFFNVIDYDKVTLSAKVPDADEVSRRLRNLAFFQQSSGEHFMQNSAMLAMLMSHRIITEVDEQGNKTYKLMTLEQYQRNAEEKILESMLTPEQKREFESYRDEINATDESKREFVYLKDDIIGRFARRYLTKAQQKEYIKKRKEIKEARQKDFESAANPTLFDQFELKNGRLAFKDGSMLQLIDTLDTTDFGRIKASDAFKLLGGFKRKVISVNKKIHGIYDKLGAAQIESKWYGPCVMQYHKHLYMGIQKRWKRRGSYNEEREEFEKGAYQSLNDYLSIPWRDYKDSMTGKQIEVMEAIQTLFKEYVKFGLSFKHNYMLLSDVDKDNIMRCIADFCTTTSALMMMIGIRVAMDGDDDKLLNFCLYEADRLASEAWMYTPTGLVTEFKTLYSSPVAGQSVVEDMFNTMNEISKMLIEGDEYNGYYKHGRYAGRSKPEVFFLRNIPIWRQYESLRDIDKSNSYYKIGSRGAGLIDTKAIAEDLK